MFGFIKKVFFTAMAFFSSNELEIENCKYRYKLVDKVVEECTKIVDGNRMLYNETLNTTISSNDYYVSSTPYIVLFAVFLVTSIIIGSVFVYFYYWRPLC